MVREAARKAARKAKAEAARDERAAAAKASARGPSWRSGPKRTKKRREEYALRRAPSDEQREAYALPGNAHIMSSKWLCTVCGGKVAHRAQEPRLPDHLSRLREDGVGVA